MCELHLHTTVQLKKRPFKGAWKGSSCSIKLFPSFLPGTGRITIQSRMQEIDTVILKELAFVCWLRPIVFLQSGHWFCNILTEDMSHETLPSPAQDRVVKAFILPSPDGSTKTSFIVGLKEDPGPQNRYSQSELAIQSACFSKKPGKSTHLIKNENFPILKHSEREVRRRILFVSSARHSWLEK